MMETTKQGQTATPNPESQTEKCPESILAEQMQAAYLTYRHAGEDLSQLYARTGRTEEAIRIVKRLNSLPSPDLRAHYHYITACLFAESEEYGAAFEEYYRALLLEPIDEKLWYFIHSNLGYCLLSDGRPDEAETYLKEAIRIDPNRCYAWKNLGVALQMQDRYAEAASAYTTATEKEPTDARALDHFEEMLLTTPELKETLPSIEDDLANCRWLVAREKGRR